MAIVLAPSDVQAPAPRMANMARRRRQHHSDWINLALLLLGSNPLQAFGFSSGGVSFYGSFKSSTRLHVSELHVPGYAQTKHSYILTEEEMKQWPIQLRNFQSDDYTSKIPYQGGYLLHQTKEPLFTVTECQSIIDEAERVASVMAWTTNRHGNFPTTDLPLVELPETLALLKVALVERVYPLLRQQFDHVLPDAGNLRVVDGFVVKYDALGGQTELKPHRDGSVLSFNIALNPADDYEGGGTWFASLTENDGAVKIDQGHVVSHASALLHGGHGITSGRRYILVAFVILEGYDNWSMRFYNQIRNL